MSFSRFHDQLWDFVRQGKKLQRMKEIPVIAGLSNASISKLILLDKLPAIKIGNCWVSDPDLVIQALKDLQPERKAPIETPSIIARRKQIEAASARSKKALRS